MRGQARYFDGVGDALPTSVDDVSTYPALLAELMRRGWGDADIARLAGNNILRVMNAAQKSERADANNSVAETDVNVGGSSFGEPRRG